MASFSFTVDDEFLKSLGTLAEVEKHMPKMLEEAAPILVEATKNALQEHKDTGSLIASVKPTEPKRKKSGDGMYVVVRPTGKDEKGVRNMQKLMHLELGTSKRAASPCLEAAKNSCEAQVLEKMREVFERETGVVSDG